MMGWANCCTKKKSNRSKPSIKGASRSAKSKSTKSTKSSKSFKKRLRSNLSVSLSSNKGSKKKLVVKKEGIVHKQDSAFVCYKKLPPTGDKSSLLSKPQIASNVNPKKAKDQKAVKSPKRSEREKEDSKKNKKKSDILSDENSIDSSKEKDFPAHRTPSFVFASTADPQYPRQQLIVSSFVTEGRRVKRWTYADSYPADQFPPPSLGAMLAARPACSRQDCELSVMEPLRRQKNTSSTSIFSDQNAEKKRMEKMEGGRLGKEKKNQEEDTKSQSNGSSSGGRRRPGEVTRCNSLTFSLSIIEEEWSLKEKNAGVAKRRQNEEAVRKKLLEVSQVLKQAISRMGEMRHRESDDSIYETALNTMVKCEKKMEDLARDLEPSKTSSQKNQKKKK